MIKRYSIGYDGIEERIDGAFVSIADYADLVRRVKSARNCYRKVCDDEGAGWRVVFLADFDEKLPEGTE